MVVCYFPRAGGPALLERSDSPIPPEGSSRRSPIVRVAHIALFTITATGANLNGRSEQSATITITARSSAFACTVPLADTFALTPALRYSQGENAIFVSDSGAKRA
jgi:hypothetical protein